MQISFTLSSSKMIFSIHTHTIHFIPFPLTRSVLTLIMKYNDKLSLFLYNIVCKYFKRQVIYEYKKLKKKKKHFLLMMPPGDAFRK